ncbi:MAG: branched-chain amino acid ABC transporter permease [Bacillota bacterium]
MNALLGKLGVAWTRMNDKPLAVAGLIAATTALVAIVPRSVVAFLLFIGSLLAVYYSRLENRFKLAIVVATLGFVLPGIGLLNRYYLDVAIQVGIYMALALGLNIVVGFAGLLDLGYVAFYATGAYVWGIFGSKQAANFIHGVSFPLSGDWFWLFLFLAVGAAATAGILLGLPVLRLKGDYLAIVTLGFGEIIRIVLNNLDKPVNLTNGPNGITPVQAPAIFGYRLDQGVHYYFLVLLILLIIITIARRLEHSRIGRAWEAIREDETAAAAMGIPVVRMKLLAFAMGASFAGIMGAVFASKQTFIDPSSFSFMESIGVLSMVILGGMGSIPGALIGATCVVVLQLQVLKSISDWFSQLRNTGVLNLPTQLEIAKYEKLVFGLVLILMTIYRPTGLIPAERRKHELEHARGEDAAAPGETGATPGAGISVPGGDGDGLA